MSEEIERIIKTLKGLDEHVRKRYKAEIVGVFGSYARGEQKRGSDLDILVRFLDGATLFDFVGLADFLEERLRVSVDVVPIDTIRKEIEENILKETIYL